jgi:trehalose 6-phosphate phosphatase
MTHTLAHDQAFETPRRLSDFFGQLSRASQRALLLDYDGTLARFRADAENATPYREVPALLGLIRKSMDTRLVIVTGRRANDAARLLGLKRLEIWGCHGLERLRADGSCEMSELDDRVLQGVADAEELLTQEGLSDMLEHKPAGTAVHWRGREVMATEIRQKVQKVWDRLSNKDGLSLESFDGGMEIRVATINKGDVVRAILSEMRSDAAIAYLGDDRTDEDAFLALHGRGLSVLVRNEYRETAADAWIRPPAGVLDFLAAWAAACGGAS